MIDLHIHTCASDGTDDIWFSEDIIFQQGRNLIYKFEPVEEFCKSWSEPYRGECTREIISQE